MKKAPDKKPPKAHKFAAKPHPMPAVTIDDHTQKLVIAVAVNSICADMESLTHLFTQMKRLNQSFQDNPEPQKLNDLDALICRISTTMHLANQRTSTASYAVSNTAQTYTAK